MEFEARFARFVGNQDGAGLFKLLRNSGNGKFNVRLPQGNGNSDPTGSLVAKALSSAPSAKTLETMITTLQTWSTRYASNRSSGSWMVPALLQLAFFPRRLAVFLDQESQNQTYRKRVVEVLRELFQGFHRDKGKREGALAVCTELLRLYFNLDQVGQCGYIISAVSQQKLDFETPVKALAVPLCYLWGKYCVFDGNAIEAEERLGWAFANCPPEKVENRRLILSYLVPCRLRFGRYPKREILERHGLAFYIGISAAVASGNVKRFDNELVKHEEEFIRSGTYLVVEKLKLLVYRNLLLNVHNIVGKSMDAEGKGSSKHKHSMVPYQNALFWQDNCDEDEATCVLSNLIYIGGIRGYLSDEHNKIVFSKETPFPPVSSWCPRQ